MAAKNKNVTIVLSVILVIALAASGYFYFSLTQSQSQVANLNNQVSNLQSQVATWQAAANASDLNINSKASIFDAKLHDLLQEHTFLLINTVRRSLDASASYPASLVALQNNINQVGVLLQPVYGSDSQQLVNLWNQKVNIFLNYSASVKGGDPNANANFASSAATYEDSVATFWSSTNNAYPVFDHDLMKKIITTHMNNIKMAVDAWNAKDYTSYFNDLEASYVQMGAYSDTIATGIIQQHPEKFL
jgi:hypothetical protein